MDSPSSGPHLEGGKLPSGRVDSAATPRDDEVDSKRVIGKAVHERTETDSILSDEAAGVKKAEAVVLAWDKNVVWAVYAWYARNL